MAVYANITELIGRTPMVPLDRLLGEEKGPGRLFAKLESMNPGGSAKDRIALAMLNAAEKAGTLKPGGFVVEATSGNTGVGLAMISAVRGYRLVLTMPENQSVERRLLFRAYGAQVVLTPATLGMKGAIGEAERIARENDAFMPMQFENPENPKMHNQTTALEILEDVPDIAGFVAGIGTGGTITGVGSAVKAACPDALVVGVEPEKSPVLSGGKPGPHGLMGIGAGFVPPILKTELLDRIVTVKEADAYAYARLCAQKEGILVGISSGAALYAAAHLAETLPGNIVVLLPDTGERYLSTPLFAEET